MNDYLKKIPDKHITIYTKKTKGEVISVENIVRESEIPKIFNKKNINDFNSWMNCKTVLWDADKEEVIYFLKDVQKFINKK